jgi:hypothetical protein
VHHDDLRKAQISEELLRTFKDKKEVKLSYCVFEYEARNGRVKKKGVDIKLLEVKDLEPSS